MAFPLSVLGLVGNGEITIVFVSWDGLSDDQAQELRSLAFDAGIALGRVQLV